MAIWEEIGLRRGIQNTRTSISQTIIRRKVSSRHDPHPQHSEKTRTDLIDAQIPVLNHVVTPLNMQGDKMQHSLHWRNFTDGHPLDSGPRTQSRKEILIESNHVSALLR